MTREYQITAPANGAPAQLSVGNFKFMLVKTITAALQISFDGSTWLTPYQNQLYQNLPSPGVVYVRTTSGLASTIDFQVDNSPLQTQVTQTSTARSYIRGNLGIPNGTAAAGGQPQCTAAGYLQITLAMNLFVPGINALGQRRQQILFYFTGANGLLINDMNGCQFTLVSTPGGQTFPFTTDADLYLSGNVGTSSVNIGEIFLLNQS